jgi:hypothetical protein
LSTELDDVARLVEAVPGRRIQTALKHLLRIAAMRSFVGAVCPPRRFSPRCFEPAEVVPHRERGRLAGALGAVDDLPSGNSSSCKDDGQLIFEQYQTWLARVAETIALAACDRRCRRAFALASTRTRGLPGDQLAARASVSLTTVLRTTPMST